MKKVSIVTLNGYFNYGNRLQNYALQETLKKLNLEVDTLRINQSPKKEVLKQFLRTIRDFFINSLEFKTKKKREEIFREFSYNLLTESSKEYYLSDDLSSLNNDTGYFVVGSDQVWNPSMNKMSSKFFLEFADKSKRIAYAPSFGISKLADNDTIEKYSQWINDIPHLSVRENEGAQLIKHLTGRDALVLADPTMLLTREEWLLISKQASNRPESPYLLTYFLGGPTDETKERLEKLANNENMTIINLGDIADKDTYETGPSEFLDYINNASAFFTDSFHGVVFSIIFETPFVVYERQSSGPSMYSRIETILDNFDMRDREANGFKEDIFSMDFSGTHEVLEREYDKSIKYLKESLRIEE